MLCGNICGDSGWIGRVRSIAGGFFVTVGTPCSSFGIVALEITLLKCNLFEAAVCLIEASESNH